MELIKESSSDSKDSITSLIMTRKYETLTFNDNSSYLKPLDCWLSSSESLIAKPPHSLTLTFLRLKLLLL